MRRAITLGLVALFLGISGTAQAALPFRAEWVGWFSLQMHSFWNAIIVIDGELSRPSYDFMWIDTPNHDPAAWANAVSDMGWTGHQARMPTTSVQYGQGRSIFWQLNPYHEPY